MTKKLSKTPGVLTLAHQKRVLQHSSIGRERGREERGESLGKVSGGRRSAVSKNEICHCAFAYICLASCRPKYSAQNARPKKEEKRKKKGKKEQIRRKGLPAEKGANVEGWFVQGATSPARTNQGADKTEERGKTEERQGRCSLIREIGQKAIRRYFVAVASFIGCPGRSRGGIQKRTDTPERWYKGGKDAYPPNTTP